MAPGSPVARTPVVSAWLLLVGSSICRSRQLVQYCLSLTVSVARSNICCSKIQYLAVAQSSNLWLVGSSIGCLKVPVSVAHSSSSSIVCRSRCSASTIRPCSCGSGGVLWLLYLLFLCVVAVVWSMVPVSVTSVAAVDPVGGSSITLRCRCGNG